MSSLVTAPNVQRYSEVYKSNLRDHWYPNENIVRLTKAYFLSGRGSGGRVLDYGCGSSENLQHLLRLGFDAVGTEIVPEAIAECERKIKAHTICSEPHTRKWELQQLDADAQALPFGDATFDHVLCNQVIYFLGSLAAVERLLSEFRRILKPGGRAIISHMSLHNHQVIREGTHLEPNVFQWKGMNLFLFDDQEHLRRTYEKHLTINEIGYFDSTYLGSTGHHYVILAEKPA